MSSSSYPRGTAIELPESVTIPRLAGIIANADFPDHTRVRLEKSHPGVELIDNPDALPTLRRANASVDTEQVTTADDAPFGAWPRLVRALERYRQTEGKMAVSADLTRSMGAFVWGDSLDLVPLHSPLEMTVSTEEGILDVQYYANGDVFLGVDFSPAATGVVVEEVVETSSLPSQTTLKNFSPDTASVEDLYKSDEMDSRQRAPIMLKAEQAGEEEVRNLKHSIFS